VASGKWRCGKWLSGLPLNNPPNRAAKKKKNEHSHSERLSVTLERNQSVVVAVFVARLSLKCKSPDGIKKRKKFVPPPPFPNHLRFRMSCVCFGLVFQGLRGI